MKQVPDEITYTMSARARSQLWDALDAYFDTIEKSELSDSSKRDYYMFAEMFVRWTEGTFIPGASVKRNEL